MNAIAHAVQQRTAYLADTAFPDDDSARLTALFDRSADYAELMKSIEPIQAALSPDTAMDALKQLRKFRKVYAQLSDIDFFPGRPGARQTPLCLSWKRAPIARSPDEPHAVDGAIVRLLVGDYQGRTWATRARPWVDRLASAWLIRRHIDEDARILWLASPAECPESALGFDFDGARFSHAGAKVTFENLVTAFGLQSKGMDRLGAIVHFLDVGGVQPPEAAGVEQVLAGLRATIADDDQLLALASGVFDGLLASFEEEGRA